MPLRAYDCIAITCLHDLDEAPDGCWIEFHVGVDECDEHACGLVNATTEREALADVHGVVEDSDCLRRHAPGLADCGVGVSVRDDNDFVGDAQFVQLANQPDEVVMNSLAFAEGGNHDGQLDIRGEEVRRFLHLCGGRQFGEVDAHAVTVLPPYWKRYLG